LDTVEHGREERRQEAGDDAGPPATPLFVFTNCTRESGSAYATGFNNTALTTEKIAMLTPMPSVNVAIAVAVNSLLSRNSFHACLMSLAMVSTHSHLA
jgi:hypothetical protein